MNGNYLDDFWEASGLNRLNFPEFANRVVTYDAEPVVVDSLEGSEAAHQLPLRQDRFHKALLHRRSDRRFAETPLSEKQVGQLLASVSETGPNQRLYPSAGGLGSVEVFALLDRVESPLGRRMVRYRPADHSLSPIRGELPDGSTLDRLCSLEGAAPPLVLIFAVRFAEMVAKYGPRGGRFALMEVGHACQNLALRISVDGLAGYQLGGVLDGDLEELLALGPGRARITLGYAIGQKAEQPGNGLVSRRRSTRPW